MTTEVKASHILVETKEEALKLLDEIKSGKAFEDVAAMHSLCPSGAAGGDLGYFGKGMMVKPFEDACFSMEDDVFSLYCPRRYAILFLSRPIGSTPLR